MWLSLTGLEIKYSHLVGFKEICVTALMMNSLNKLGSILELPQKKKFIYLVFLVFVGVLFELLGIGILLPVLSTILDPSFAENDSYINLFPFFADEYNHEKIVLFVLAILLLVYLSKTLFFVYLNYFQGRYLSGLMKNISDRLFTNYMLASYSFHSSTNSSKMIKNLSVEVSYFNQFCVSMISLLVESSMIIAVVSALLLIEPIGTLVTGGVLIFLVLIFHQVTKKKLASYGLAREVTDSILTKSSLEGLNGIKEIKVLQKEVFFIDSYKEATKERAKINTFQTLILNLPRFYLEFVSILGLVLLIGYLTVSNIPTDIIITTVGVFVAAVFRVLPSVNKVLTSFQNIKFYNSSIQVIHNQLLKRNSLILKNLKSIAFNKDIKISQLSFKYENDDKFVFRDLNFTIKKGSSIGVIGPSGSGKSTFVDILLGLYEPTSGSIKVDDKVIDFNIETLNKNIGYVPQEVYLFDDTIIANIAVGIDNVDMIKINKALEKAQLKDFIFSLKDGLLTPVGERGAQISGGQKQRIGIARALYNDPELLIFDEATSALDNNTEEELIKAIEALKSEKTILMIAHRMSTLKNCDQILNLLDYEK
jgi:ATP-binding cassette, subfamily B, bacterial PglK